MGSFRENDIARSTSTPLPAKNLDGLAYGNLIMGVDASGKTHFLSATQDSSGKWVLDSNATISGDVNIEMPAVETGGYIGKPSTGNGDFSVAYNDATSIILSDLPTDIDAFYINDVVSIVALHSDGTCTIYQKCDLSMSLVAGVLTIPSATLVSTDTFTLYTSVPRPSGSGSGSSSPDAEYTSPKDFTATYTSATSITLTGLPVSVDDSSQVAYITVIPLTGDSITYTQGSGATLRYSSGVITIEGVTDPFTTGDVYQIGLNGQKKAFDASTDTNKVTEQNPLWARYIDEETLVTEQDLTAAYADFGSEIDMQGFNRLGVAVTADVNDSTGILLQVLGLMESSGTEYTIDGAAVKTLPAADGSIYYEFDVGTLPFVKIQAMATVLGASAGDLTISINKVWRD